jgi:hypothetical protein
MKKVKFWMDFCEERVIGKKELEERHAEWVEKKLKDHWAWEEWLSNNYSVLDIFNASEQKKKDIMAEYEELVKQDVWDELLDGLSEIEVDFEDLTIVEG